MTALGACRPRLLALGWHAPGTGFDETLAAIAEAQILELANNHDIGCTIHEIWKAAREMNMDPSALAARCRSMANRPGQSSGAFWRFGGDSAVLVGGPVKRSARLVSLGKSDEGLSRANSRTSCVIFIEQNLGPHMEQKCAVLAPSAGSVWS